MEKIFLQGDVDAIKTYVFEAPGLPQIRGGSQRLVECEEKVQAFVESLGGKTIYCSGGGFLFEILADQAEAIKRGIERIYFEHTLVATVTVVYEERSAVLSAAPDITDGWAGRLVRTHKGFQEAGKFAGRTAFLAARLREAKNQKAVAPFIEAFPFGKQCDICGKRVAEHEVPYAQDGGTEIKQLCRVCYQRHEKGQKERSGAFGEFIRNKGLTVKAKPAQDLDGLVKSARRTYLAFLYADGNNIGSVLQKVKNEREFEALSKALEKATQRALFEALWGVCSSALQNDEHWPFEILNIGGDDVTLFIQAGYAWDVAIAFLGRFEHYVREEMESRLGYWPQAWPERITASVGIAVAEVKHPVRYLEALAADLLKRAKKVAKEAQASAINFLWLPNAIAVTEAKMMDDLYRRGDLILTARPYTLAQAKKVQSVVNVLSRWPRSLRHRWGEALEQGRWASLSLILYDLARRRSQPRGEEVPQLLKTLQELPEVLGNPADAPTGYLWWQDQENGKVVWRTALLDALELAELRAMRPDVQEEGE